MSANLGSTTYTSVVWTAGDVITEAKLDNMVANDQAYDSHAAQGLLLNNNKSFASKNAAGSANHNLIKEDTNDDIQVGENNTAGHTVINAGSSKLVKVKVLRQDNTTNTYTANSVILSGWGFVVGDGANAYMTKTVTFGITFSQIPIVLTSCAGVKTGSDPTTAGDFSQSNDTLASGQVVTATNFIGIVYRIGGAVSSSFRFGFHWLAVGQLN